jgi:hypothetical protein
MVSISLTSGIKVDSGVWYGLVAQARTKVIGVGTKMQDVSIDDGPSSKGKRFVTCVCTRVPRVGTKVQSVSRTRVLEIRCKGS